MLSPYHNGKRFDTYRVIDAFPKDVILTLWSGGNADEENHAPNAVCNGDMSRQVLQQKVKPGDAVRLSAAGSSDPDGDRLRCRWWIYNEAGTCPGEVAVVGSHTAEAKINVPPQATGQIHVILEVTDDGTPPLTAYQ